MLLFSRTKCATTLTSLAVISSNYNGDDGLAFGNRPCIPRPSGWGWKITNRLRNASSSSTSLTMVNFDDLATMMPLESMIDPTSATSSLASIMLAYATAAADPKLELELMNDASNVALDVSSFLNPSTVWLRLCNVLGRILIISAAIQKGITAPDEWLFQLTMLGISMRLLLGSAMPLVFAVFSISSLSVRDRRTFLLFESVGLTVLQYKTLLASTTLDWIQYEADTSVELDGSYMYFLYSGEATTQLAVTSNKEDTFDTSVESIRSDAKLLGASNRIFGDVQFAAALESLVYKKTTKSSKSDKKAQSQVVVPDGNSTAVAESRFVVGSQGASMLRISTDKIIKLMKNDTELTSSIQRFVSISMQEKLRSSSRFLRTSRKGGNVVVQSRSSNTTTASSSSIHNSTPQVIFML